MNPPPPEAPCDHRSRLALTSPATFPDHPVVDWCALCGCLLDTVTDELLAGPSDYRARWADE